MTTERRDDPKGLPSIMADGTKVFYDDRPVVERGVERRKAERRVRDDIKDAIHRTYPKHYTMGRSGSDRRSGDGGGSGAAVEGEGGRVACIKAVDFALADGWRAEDIVGLLRGAQRYANGFVVAVCSRCRKPEYTDGLILTEVIDAGDDLSPPILGGAVCPQCKMEASR